MMKQKKSSFRPAQSINPNSKITRNGDIEYDSVTLRIRNVIGMKIPCEDLYSVGADAGSR